MPIHVSNYIVLLHIRIGDHSDYSNEEETHIMHELWTPSAYTAFKALLSARLCAAIWSNISDCDEVFNYWEPVSHYSHD